MSWKLYLDDCRDPYDGWVLARNAREAMYLIALEGAPAQASLDHDLNDNLTGLDFVEWMVKTGKWPWKRPVVHSANPIGAAAMRALIDRAGPYRGEGVFVTVPGLHNVRDDDLHPGELKTTVLGTHRECLCPACCRCACPGCMEAWRQAAKPLRRDCK